MPSQTSEHWFLDLDGVRSGPYQIAEVMSLIAEGEVLPHHRISLGLKDKPWITILDWRLEQAKKISQPEVQEVKSYIPESARPQAPEELKLEIEEVRAELSLPANETESNPASNTAASQPTANVIRPVPTQTFKAPVEASPASEKPTKRDTAAEMFDMLQTSKQKREAKTQAAQNSQTQALTEANNDDTRSGIIKTIGVVILVTIIGFALGQIFQQNSAPPPAPVVTATPTATPESKPAEIVDRSNEKITIRKLDPKPTPTPLPVRAATPAPRVSEHDLEELKDLKKELQELKALKDELRGNNQNDSLPEPEVSEPESDGMGTGEVDPAYNYYNPAAPAPGSGGTVLPETPEGQGGGAGQTAQPNIIHY